MTDQDVRDFFERLATLEPMPARDPVPLVHRGRRRLVRNLAGGALAATIAVGLVVGGTSLLLSDPSTPAPAAPTGATSVESPALTGATSAPTGDAVSSTALTGNLVPDAGPFRRGGEVLEHACCNGAIAAVDPSSGESRLLVEPAELGEAAWSPDGTRLAFEVSCGFSGGNINPSTPCTGVESEAAGLYVMNATEEPTLIASYYRSGRIYMAYDRHFAWSPDGSKLAFALLGDGLYVAGADGSNAAPVGSASDGFHGSPSWAPDGSAITYATDDGVFVVRSNGGETIQLSDVGEDPVWSPDGSHIAFTRGDAVFVVRPDGRDLRQVADGYEFAWSPSGDRLVYHLEDPLDPGFAEELWVVGADGSNAMAIVDSACCAGIVDGSLIWAPEGDGVAFLISKGNETWHVAAADGSQVAMALEDFDPIDARTAASWLPCLCTIF